MVKLTLRGLESHRAAEQVCSLGFPQASIRLGFERPSDEGEVVCGDIVNVFTH
jgi:hypothetical protein